MEIDFAPFLKLIRNYLEKDSSGHDYFHAERVFKMAMKIQETEWGDKYVIGVAAILHDVMRPWEKETKKSHFWPEALEKISDLLKQINVDDEKLSQILEVIARHDIYDWSNPEKKSIELQIVQDADNIDAIGAIGIARTFMYAWSHNSPMWIPGESLDFNHDYVENGNNTSIICHFYEKLLKLAENMNTSTGKAVALERHQFMKQYLEEFFGEWEWLI